MNTTVSMLALAAAAVLPPACMLPNKILTGAQHLFTAFCMTGLWCVVQIGTFDGNVITLVLAAAVIGPSACMVSQQELGGQHLYTALPSAFSLCLQLKLLRVK